jgi:hypothetical protein
MKTRHMKVQSLIFIPLLIAFGYSCTNGTAGNDDVKPVVNISTTRSKATEAFQYCKEKEFNTSFCILVDMSLHSGVSRFFVWDFSTDTIRYSFPVGHGCCDNPWSGDYSKINPTFSNKDGSHCSSLGKYKIGERGYSEWGVNVKYLMHGLESTNTNALRRQIVFHSWDAVADGDVYPDGTPEGWGCPTLSNNNFKLVDPLIKSSKKPVLFWIYR